MGPNASAAAPQRTVAPPTPAARSAGNGRAASSVSAGVSSLVAMGPSRARAPRLTLAATRRPSPIGVRFCAARRYWVVGSTSEADLRGAGMWSRRGDHRWLEGALRAQRAEAPDELVEDISGKVSAAPVDRRRAWSRVAFASAVSV